MKNTTDRECTEQLPDDPGGVLTSSPRAGDPKYDLPAFASYLRETGKRGEDLTWEEASRFVVGYF